MRNKEFWIDAAERALKTFAQALLALLTIGTPIWAIDWQGALGIAATATMISLLTSIAGTRIGNPQTASFVNVGAPESQRKE